MTSSQTFPDPSDCEVDVLIVGAGPAGLMASLCCHTFGLSVLHIDDRAHPTLCGRADGLQPRTIEVLRNIGQWQAGRIVPATETPKVNELPSIKGLGLAKRMIARGSRMFELAFWNPTGTDPLARTSQASACPDFIDIRDRYLLLLHQGHIEREFLAEISARSPASKLLRPYQFLKCHSHPDNGIEYPVESIVRSEDQKEKKIRSKYVLGCDGSRSNVRMSLGEGVRLEGEISTICWGVMDCWVESTFPDLRKGCMVNSKADGAILIIPREDNLVRFYVHLKEVNAQSSKESLTLEMFQDQAKKILSPYTINFEETDWFGVYEVKQQLANKYTLDGRVILGGDAAHTHSPKAAQGMNISMMDMFSLAWKINLIEKGIGKRDAIIETYETERRGVASEMLAFDERYSYLFSGVKKTGVGEPSERIASFSEPDPQELVGLYKQSVEFTTGCGAVYHANVFNALPDSDLMKHHPRARTVGSMTAGHRMLPGQVTRMIDGNPVKLEHEIKMDGAFRIHIFLGSVPPGNRLDHLNSSRCFLQRFRASGGLGCSIFDSQRPGPNPFFTLLLISSQPRGKWEIAHLPPLFSGPYRSQIYVDDQANHIAGNPAARTCTLHYKYGIKEDETGGGIMVVRPDGYVGLVTELNQSGWETVEMYFDGFLHEKDRFA